ncbi:MAG: hypothetical protein PHH77_01910 [Victivallaceae bacterium]|nr:hypothetical protein [Victivallaceae bacterium]
MSRLFLPVLAVGVFCSALPFTGHAEADEDLSAADFLYRARHPAGRKRWAVMDGEVIHRRRGRKTVKAALYLAILFNPDRTLAQVAVNRQQGYMVGQTFAQGRNGTSVIPLNQATKTSPILGNFGLRPQDLTMSFLYWDLVRELPEETTKMIDCRVFELKSPAGEATVRVWISKKYYCPIKAEWHPIPAGEPSRTLEVTSFRQQDNYGIVKQLELYGPGWRTRINFTKTEVGVPEHGIVPKNLFLKL